MSGHRWHSIFSLSLVAALAGCQTDGSGKYAWNPFLKKADTSVSAKEDSSFSLPKFSGRNTADTAKVETADRAPMAAEQLERLLEQGQVALRDNRLDDARKAYSDVLDSSPDNATAHHGMAMAADLSEQWSDAEDHYRQALRIRPRDANLLCDIGYSYLLQNRYSEASRYLNHAVEINPQHENAQMNLALLDLRQGHRAAAEQRISQRFGSSPRASQILAQLESQVGKSEADTLPPQHSVIPANATFEQIQEMAAREKIEAEHRRRMKGIPQESPIVAVGDTQRLDAGPHAPQHEAFQHNGFDPRTGMPFTQQPGMNQQSQSGAIPAHEMARQGAAAIANYGDPGAVSPPNGNAVENPQPWASAPAGTMNQGYQQPNSMAPPANPGIPYPTQPAVYSTNGVVMNAGAGGQGVPAAMASPNSGSVMSSGMVNPSASAAQSNVVIPGQIIPVHSSGAFPAPPTNRISYGQPLGFGGAGGQMPVNTANISNSTPMSANSPTGAMTNANPATMPAFNPQGSSGMNSAQRMYLEGLNAGPGALFPIGQAASNQTAPSANMQNGPASSDAGTNGSLKMGNISSPGTNSMINGAMYGQPQNTMPAQEWMNQQQQQLQLQQSQRSQGSTMQHSGTARQESVTAAWPSARPPQSNPLEVYDQQRQQLDNDYNRTLQTMDRQNPANRNLQ